MAGSTQDTFVNAFLDLLYEKEYTKISIIDVAKKCNSTRQTFYYHFKSIDEMVIWAIRNDTDIACGSIAESKNWSEASKSFVEVLNKYEILFQNAKYTKKATFVYSILCDNAEYFIHKYTEIKPSNQPFTEFMYKALKYLVVGLALEELQKDEPDFNNIIYFVNQEIPNEIEQTEKTAE